MAKGETYEEFIEKFKPKLTTDGGQTMNKGIVAIIGTLLGIILGFVLGANKR